MSTYFNIPVQTTTNTYAVTVYTADGYKFEKLVNAISAKSAQGIGFREVSNYYKDCGKEFIPTKITAYKQDFKTMKIPF